MAGPGISNQQLVAPANADCSFQSHIILMKGITWSRDSHGLFDYESKHLTKKTMRTTETVCIVRRGNELSMIQYNPSLPL